MNYPTPAMRSAAMLPYYFHSAPRLPASGRRPIGFGHFVALPAARTLLLKGVPVEIGGRAFDLLMVLLRSRGEVVGKEEIVRQVWPTTIVDEGNLRFQMAVLRKALGADRDRIKTVTGRGYLFVADEAGSDDLPARDGLPYALHTRILV
jgi:DNA-binding winged helix-turn-helix (wHTH) protein